MGDRSVEVPSPESRVPSREQGVWSKASEVRSRESRISAPRPILEALPEQHHDGGIAVIGSATRDSGPETRDLSARARLPWAEEDTR